MIVLGGGIIGKTAALALAQRGFKVLHLSLQSSTESAQPTGDLTQNAWQSRVYALSPSSKKLFQELHIWDALTPARIQNVQQMCIYGDSGKNTDVMQFSAFEGAVPQLAWIVESDLIENALRLACQFQQNLTQKIITSSKLCLNGPVPMVQTNIGDFGAKLMIAADGSNSPTRQSLNISVEEKLYAHEAIIANFACTQPTLQTAHQWFLPGGDILALLPLPDKKVSLVWSSSHAQTLLSLGLEHPKAFAQKVEEQALGKVREIVGALSLMNTPSSFSLKRLEAKQVISADHPKHQTCVVLIGDAAHVMHPLAGQGLNIGLRDITDLVNTLQEKEAFRAINDRVLLRRYERKRAGDVRAILELTHHLHQLFLRSDTPTQWLRNQGMRLLNQQPFIKRQLIAKAMG